MPNSDDPFVGLDSYDASASSFEAGPSRVREDPPPSNDFLPDDLLPIIDSLLCPNENTDLVILSDSDDELPTPICAIRCCNCRRDVKARSSIINNLYGLSSHENPLCSKCHDLAKSKFEKMLEFDFSNYKYPVVTEKEDLSIITIDGDDKDTSERLENLELLEWSKQLPSHIASIDKKIDFKPKHDEHVEKLGMKMDALIGKINDFSTVLHRMDRELIESAQALYRTCKGVLVEEASVCFDAEDPDNFNPSATTTDLPKKPPGLPPRGKLEKKRPVVGQEVYVVKVSEFSDWVLATVESIIVRENIQEQDKKGACRYKVRVVCNTPNNSSTTYVKEVSEEQVAYKNPATVRLIIGQRVISLYRYGQRPGHYSGKCRYYSGIIAEVPNQANNYRYLIFFENGNVQYSSHEELRVTVATRDLPHKYFPLSSQQFIKDYFERLPERKIINVNTMDVVKIELKGKWMDARVTAVDSSLMEVFYPKAQIKEWLYRGSSRMLSMTDYLSKSQILLREAANQNARAIRTTGIRRGRYMYSNLIDNEDDPDDPPVVSRGVAKKSITRSNMESGPDIGAPSKMPVRDESAGSMQTILLPTYALQPKNRGRHVCSSACVSWTNYNFEKTSGVNPLVVPMLFGYRRVDQPQVTGKGRDVYYFAPCGMAITDYEDLLSYMRLTKSPIPVDMFNFEPWVKLFDEFVSPSDCVIIKDMAENKEHHPVPVVNCLDASLPPYMDYITSRRATDGVPLNLDPEFLTCCDCEDDCRDQTKCACFQRTLSNYYETLGVGRVGEEIIPQNVESIGYKNRRLLENVLSGIYECNSRCKCCTRTCLNRVVQQPMSVKLELFKTRLKGWGTRCLNDLPAGCFVCTYVGRILTEDDANEDGRKHGDEYFAELDYIEYMENLKENYESSPKHPEDAGAEERYGVFGDSSSEEEEEEEISQNSDVKTKSFGNQISPEEKKKYMPHRLYYGKDEKVYVMDAKSSGNIGRYFNHSCEPNIFVQNVFVDTHDLRFPWVAFFTKHYIRAGTELTWDYQYTIGSVPGKEMYCHCQTKKCRGRLL